MRRVALVVALAAWVASAGAAEPAEDSHARPPLPSPAEIARLPADGGPEFNRLIHESSPYLLQHARNPVDWYPWGEEALAKARAEEKPIFLSVGYSTCHWCHVMEHESFEDDAVAELLRRHYVAIKVDREERPDLDRIYMAATQLVTGRGGWPNSLWLTPDGDPWYAGTYFPRDRFARLLAQLATAWREQRSLAVEQGAKMRETIGKLMAATGGGQQAVGPLTRALVDDLLRGLEGDLDGEHGGFGGAPKFPPHQSLRLLLHEYFRGGEERWLRPAVLTLEAMSRGGIHDHVGGGFHRYSTDRRWFLPHFEKMLYDNALLARSYVDGFLATKDPWLRHVAEGILGWVLREMRGRHGAFSSAIDADSGGEEGTFYLWRPAELREVLGEDRAAEFGDVYGVTADGNYREEASGRRTGASLLFLRRDLGEEAAARKKDPETFLARLAQGRADLLRARGAREAPGLDDKVLTAWNGLMIGALAYAGDALGQAEYVAAARRAADFILRECRKGSRLLRTYRGGSARLPGYLVDYAFLADGLLDLGEATGETRWVAEAENLVGVLEEDFRGEEDGGYFFTGKDHERLLTRTKDPTDSALPSGNGVAARVLVRLAKATGKARYVDAARRIFRDFHALMRRAPRGMQSMLLALSMFLEAGYSVEEDGDGDEGEVRAGPLEAEVDAGAGKVPPGGTLAIEVELEIDEGWHVNSASPRLEYLIPTRLVLRPHPAGGLAGVAFPAPISRTLGFADAPLDLYEGEVELAATFAARRDAPPGRTTLTLELTAQPCDATRCLDPVTLALPVEIEVAVGP